ncbi:energy transducer TonB [Neolewinella antarctica]|uniref:TonB family protein n=1 Tax=Neolewinella antarctica TaxID=442734 RepID=A0ABX0XGQ9_9BACT|nr:energy transducer TonB [Neolewinella antarctica]NJC28526.1 TonB family protein [Neolewinella antarctica]
MNIIKKFSCLLLAVLASSCIGSKKIPALGIQERMAGLKSCLNEFEDHDSYYNCTNSRMLEFVYTNLSGTDLLNSDRGKTVVVSFDVSSTGKIEKIKLLRSVRKDLDDAVIQATETLNELDWVPTVQSEYYVSTRFNLPFKIK